MRKINSEITKFLNKHGFADYEISPLIGGASDRCYYRLNHGTQSVILMDSSKVTESLSSFLKTASYLLEKNYSVPKILHANNDKGFLILEDLGDDTFVNYL